MGLFKKKKKDLKEFNSHNKISFLDFTSAINTSIDPSLNSTFVSVCSANARHLSKIKPRSFYKNEPSKIHKYLNDLLSLRPNPLMSASQFWEVVAYKYFADNISLVFCEWDYENVKEPLKALYPLDVEKNSVVVSEQENGDYIFKFTLNGKEMYTNHENLIILTRNADIETLFGGRSKAIDIVLKLLQTNYQGIEQAIKTSSYLRFILKSPTPQTQADLKRKSEQFSQDFMQGNKTGVVYADGTYDIIPINQKIDYIKSEDMGFLKTEVLQYLGANEKILTATYNENEWQSYYETTLEPFIIKLQDELTYKLFTKFERQNENRIVVETNRLQTASLATRVAIADRYIKLPVVKPNIINELLYLPKTENGDKEYSTLNYVQTDKQNEYQGINTDKETDSDENSENPSINSPKNNFNSKDDKSIKQDDETQNKAN